MTVLHLKHVIKSHTLYMPWRSEVFVCFHIQFTIPTPTAIWLKFHSKNHTLESQSPNLLLTTMSFADSRKRWKATAYVYVGVFTLWTTTVTPHKSLHDMFSLKRPSMVPNNRMFLCASSMTITSQTDHYHLATFFIEYLEVLYAEWK